MFTGIIEACAAVRRIDDDNGHRRVVVSLPQGWKLQKGESVNVDGVCSTIIATTRATFTVAYMPTTLRRTRCAQLIVGMRVNLERSLRFGDRLNGHFVTGHVDGVARIITKKNDGASQIMTLTHILPQHHLLVVRGSVALNGVSLTIAKKNTTSFAVALIPATLRHTNLGTSAIDDTCNIEYDLVTKIISEQLRTQQS